MREKRKSKINLVINENLLEEIDKIIKKNGDKRSRFIEKIMQKYINKNKEKL